MLKGAEVDILKDGSLDLEMSTLKAMDCVVASVHSNFKMSEEEMTARIVKALDTGLVHVLGPPDRQDDKHKRGISRSTLRKCSKLQRRTTWRLR